MGIVPLPGVIQQNPAVAEVMRWHAAADGSRKASGSNPRVHVGSDDPTTWSEEPMRAVLAEMMRGVVWVARSVNRFAPGEFEAFTVQTRAEYVIVQRDGGLGARNHPMTAWTGIYCVEAPAPAPERLDSGQLRIYESRMGNMFADATTDTMTIPFRPGHYGWTLKPGVLVVFPGGLLYEIAPVRGDGELLVLTVRARFLAPGQTGVTGW